MLELRHISKSFGPLLALDDVSLAIPPGRILGLLGENGAGKSTLMNVLFGLMRPDAGTIHAGGREVRITSPRVAQGLGIGMVHQHFKLVPSLTTLENFALFLAVPRAVLRARAQAWLERLRWSVPLDVRIDDLAVGQQQRAEIVKALLVLERTGRGAHQASVGESATEPVADRLLILDEPTAVLTPQETGELFAAMRTLRDDQDASGGTAIVFISHKLAEVREICDDLAILRRGRLVHGGAVAELSADAIAEKMVGAPVAMPLGRQKIAASWEPGKAALRLENVSTGILKNVSLQVLPGEILGIAGVDGNGQSHLVQSILGVLRPKHGEIFIAGERATDDATRLRLDKVAFIAEDRQKEALVLPLSIRDNLLLKDYRARRFSTLGWLRFGAWNSHAKKLLAEFDIRATSAAEAAGQLSGGNQQKVVLARELHAGDKPIILAVNPTRGLDIGAAGFVLQRLLDARRRGAAVLLIHSDLDELLAISDRVAVIYNGTLLPTAWPAAAKEEIGRLMLGLREAV